MMLPRGLRIYVALEPVNMQLSFDRLAGLVRERLEQEPQTGATVVVFPNRRRTQIKLLWLDKSGYCLLYKRLDRGTFRCRPSRACHDTHFASVQGAYG